MGGRVGIILKCILRRDLYGLIASNDCGESDIETSFSVRGEGFLTNSVIVIWPKILLHSLMYKGCEYFKLKKISFLFCVSQCPTICNYTQFVLSITCSTCFG